MLLLLLLLSRVCTAWYSFAGGSLARVPSSSSSSLQMAADNAALKTFDSLEKSLAPVPPGGGFWFGSSGFWGEEDYRGFVDTYKADNLLNVRFQWMSVLVLLLSVCCSYRVHLARCQQPLLNVRQRWMGVLMLLLSCVAHAVCTLVRW